MIHIKKVMCVCSVLCTVMPHTSPAFGAFEYMGLGWPAATANIRVLGNHPNQFVLNPALMEGPMKPHIALSYQPPFQSLDLQAGALTIINTFRQKAYSHNLEYFGDELYTELKVSSGTSWKVQEGYRLGMSLNSHRLGLSGFSSQHALTLSFSSYAHLTDQLKLGSAVENVIQVKSRLSIPQKFHLGVQYEAGEATRASVLLALEKESALPLEVCLGLLLSSKSFWQVGFGYRDVSGMASVGWRIHTQRMAFHYVCVMHPHLPVSNGFGLELILP